MSHTLTEGGQITSHRLRMLRQVIKIALYSSLLFGLFLFILNIIQIPKCYYTALWYHLQAHLFNGFVLKMEVDKNFIYQMTHQNYGYDPSLPIADVIKMTTPIVHKFTQDTYSYLLQALKVSLVCSACILIFFFYRGRISKAKQHISGPKVISASWIRLKLKLARKASPFSIGSLPLVKGTETQHMLITGGSGSGKSNCLHHLLKQIRRSKQKTIIVDTSGIFLERYYRPGKDIILNPFDKKSASWHPWCEGQSACDYADIAESFIPLSQSEGENYWRSAAKTVFISLLKKFEDSQKTSEIIQWIQYESLSNLCKLVAGTKAAAHMDLSSEKTASSIRSVASTFLECLENLPDTTNPFSIREWLSIEDDSWLFLQCLPSQRAILRPLMTSWISSSIKGLLSLPIDLNRRIWFVIDELPTLQRIKDFETLLTEGRKYGGCGIITIQSPAQIENIYGKDISKIIIGNTATKVIFRERDPEIAEKISRAFGECEVIEIQEGISYGAHEARDGVNLSLQNKVKRVVSVTQILDLPINTAYVKLADEKAVSQVKLSIAST